MSPIQVLRNNSVENDDWMKTLPGYQQEVALSDALRKASEGGLGERSEEMTTFVSFTDNVTIFKGDLPKTIYAYRRVVEEGSGLVLYEKYTVNEGDPNYASELQRRMFEQGYLPKET